MPKTSVGLDLLATEIVDDASFLMCGDGERFVSYSFQMAILSQTEVRSFAHGIRGVVITSDYTFSRHSHDEFGVGVITAGGHRSDSGCGTVEAKQADVITVSPGEIHDGAPMGRRSRSWTMLYLEPWLIASVTKDEDRLGTKDSETEFKAPVISDRKAGWRVQRFWNLIQSSSAVAEGETEEALSDMIVPLLRLRSRREPPTMIGLAQAIERIRDNAPSAPTLEELAKIADVSRFQLIRAVKRKTGFTPFALLRQTRLDLARRAILSGCTICEAATEAGFSDQSHLTRAFRAAYGVTPGALSASVY